MKNMTICLDERIDTNIAYDALILFGNRCLMDTEHVHAHGMRFSITIEYKHVLNLR